LVVQEALDTTLWFALSYSEWFTPTTLVRLSHGGTTKQGDTNGDPLYLFIIKTLGTLYLFLGIG
jgi:hypothetical protein